MPAGVNEVAQAILGHASVTTTTLNILCNVVGGAVLALPGAFQRMSFIPGLILMGMACALSWLAVSLITKTCARTRLLTFQDLVIHASGSNALLVRFFTCGFFVFPIGIVCAYMKVIIESMPQVMRFLLSANAAAVAGEHVLVQEGFWVLVASLLLVPLCALRQMADLVWVSVMGLATVLFTGVSVIGLFASGRYTSHYNASLTPSLCVDSWLRNATSPAAVHGAATSIVHPALTFFRMRFEDFFVAFPVVAMALTCHNNVPFFYAELRHRSERRMMTSVYLAGGFTTVFYLSVGLAGYLMFGPSVALAHGNVLNCMSWNDGLIVVCRIVMAVHFCCVYPINCISARKVLNRIIFPGVEEGALSRLTLWIEAVALVGISAIVAYAASGVEVVFAMNGSLFGLLLTFALPAYCYIKLVNSCSLCGAREAAPAVLPPVDRGATSAVPAATVAADDGAELCRMGAAGQARCVDDDADVAVDARDPNDSASSGDDDGRGDDVGDAGVTDDVRMQRRGRRAANTCMLDDRADRAAADSGAEHQLPRASSESAADVDRRESASVGGVVPLARVPRPVCGRASAETGRDSARRQPSSLLWRCSVWLMLFWGIAGTVLSITFSVRSVTGW